MLFGAASAILTLGGRLFTGALVSHCSTAPRSRDEQPRVGNWLARGRVLLITVGVTLCPAAMGWAGLGWACRWARLLHPSPAPSPSPHSLHSQTFSPRSPQKLKAFFMLQAHTGAFISEEDVQSRE